LFLLPGYFLNKQEEEELCINKSKRRRSCVSIKTRGGGAVYE
jgi:hypothetical protein